MILIVSETQDGSTYKVIHWLDSLSKKWICITEQDNIEFIFSGKEIILQIKQMNINLSDISSFWYRSANSSDIDKENYLDFIL